MSEARCIVCGRLSPCVVHEYARDAPAASVIWWAAIGLVAGELWTLLCSL